ncbi:MAG TPA: copper chaperone PCu(A)C [Rhizomicrobium sp.]|nr:copper chaperone PCu(A)C [Rhizomicrobium sp.]
MLKIAGLCTIAVGFCIGSVAPASAAGIAISHGWFRMLPSGQPAGGYFTMKNSGTRPVDLVAAQSAACGMLMLHRSVSNSGTSRMEDVRSVSIPSGGTFSFAPGGYHLMCMDPGAAMAPGKSVPVTLVFSDGSKVNANFAVKNAAGE